MSSNNPYEERIWGFIAGILVGFGFALVIGGLLNLY